MTKKELCEMCDNYSADVKCDNQDSCKLMRLLEENKSLKAENRELKAQVSKLKHEMSYMISPCAIGDRNGEMGW